MYFTIKRDTLGSVMMKFGEFYNCKIRPRVSVEILELRVENIRKMNKLYYFATWCTCLLYAGFPILQSFFGWNKSDTVNKILPTVYPFDISETPAYEIIYVYEFIECITIAVLLPAVDIFFCSVGYLLCTQLLLIQKSILPIDTNSIEQNISESDLQGIPIKSFIEDHTIVLKMCNSLRDMVSPLLLLQLLVSVTTFSFVIYRLTYVDTESDTFLYFVDGAKAAMYFVTTFIQFAPYCWISNELQQANEDVGFAVYCTNWYERDSNFRNSVRMIQLQSNKEISMNALKLLKVNLNTIVDILKLSYSYYTLLSQISKE